MFSRFFFIVCFSISLISFNVMAFAGKIELTTYYPAPHGEYKNLTSTEASYFATSSGNVGIGTTNPVAKLQISGNITNNISRPLYVQGSSGAAHTAAFANSDGYGLGIGGIDSAVYASIDAARSTDGGSTVTAIPLALNKSGGNVGIGTTSPAARLDVSATLGGKAFHSFSGAGSGANYGGDFEATGGGLTSPGPTNFGGYFKAHGGPATNYAGYFTASGGATGTTNIAGYFSATGSPADNYGVYIANGGGYINTPSWTYGSDKRLKKNIAYFDNGMDKVMQLKPAKFDYINGQKEQLGFIAQDVQSVIPEAVTVTDEKTGMLGLKVNFVIPYMVNAIKTLKAENDALKIELQTQIKSLKKEIAELKKR